MRSVTVHVASMNTRPFTELCLRSMWRTAGAPFRLVVGDVSSTDGSAEMLRTFERQGRLTLQEAAYPRYHGEWIDGWRAECRSDVAVVVDSDVEFVRHGWLPRLLDRLDGHAMVAYRRVPESTYTETRPQPPTGEHNPMVGVTVTLLPRPDPCVLAIDQHATADVTASFAWQPADDEQPPRKVYDTAGAFARALDDAGLSWVTLDETDRAMFVHYQARTWQQADGRRLRWQLAAKLTRLRALDAAHSAKASMVIGADMGPV